MKEQETIYTKIGYNITVARSKTGLSQEELAKRVRLSRASIVNIEAGRQRLTIDNLYLVCAALGCKIRDILPNTFNRFLPCYFV